MLARTPSCLECGRLWGAPGFRHEDNRPLYWSDTGLLCSAPCASEHFRKRKANRTFVSVPLDCPVDVEV